MNWLYNMKIMEFEKIMGKWHYKFVLYVKSLWKILKINSDVTRTYCVLERRRVCAKHYYYSVVYIVMVVIRTNTCTQWRSTFIYIQSRNIIWFQINKKTWKLSSKKLWQYRRSDFNEISFFNFFTFVNTKSQFL